MDKLDKAMPRIAGACTIVPSGMVSVSAEQANISALYMLWGKPKAKPKRKRIRKRSTKPKRAKKKQEAPNWTLHGPNGTTYYHDVAKECGIAPSTILEWIRKGTLPAVVLKRRRGTAVYDCKYVQLESVRDRCKRTCIGKWKVERTLVDGAIYVKMAEAKKETGFSSGAIYRWYSRGYVRGRRLKPGGPYWYHLEDLRNHAKSRKGGKL